MAKESIEIEKMGDKSVIDELKAIIEQQKQIIAVMSKQIDVLTMSVKQEIPLEAPKNTIEVIQINTKDKKKFFCKDPREQQVFEENYPGRKVESFKIELIDYVAKDYLDKPENKKAFERKTA